MTTAQELTVKYAARLATIRQHQTEADACLIHATSATDDAVKAAWYLAAQDAGLRATDARNDLLAEMALSDDLAHIPWRRTREQIMSKVCKEAGI